MGAMCIAQRIFDNQLERHTLDDELHEMLEAAGISGWKYSDCHFDEYDSSIEFDICAPDFSLAQEHQAALWKMGFARCWLNHSDGSETYYFEGGNPDGCRKKASGIVTEGGDAPAAPGAERVEPGGAAETHASIVLTQGGSNDRG